MSYLRFLARRAVFALVSMYIVVTAMFVLINARVRDPLQDRIAFLEWDGATPEQIAEVRQRYLNTRNLETPVYERYLDWLVDVTTFDWGYSFAYQKPVIAVIDGRIPTTLEYVIPGVVLAVLFGVLFGLFAALRKDGVLDWTVRTGAYALLGIPAFMVAFYITFLTKGGPQLHRQVVAAVAVAGSLFAGQFRFARVSSLEQTGQEFVKLLRAKGADRVRLARHVLRNAAIPIVTLSFTELLAVLMLNIYVIEDVLGIRGLAGASLRAVRESDIPLVIWTTMVLVFIGIGGNFVQDVLYGYLDPRIHAE